MKTIQRTIAALVCASLALGCSETDGETSPLDAPGNGGEDSLANGGSSTSTGGSDDGTAGASAAGAASDNTTSGGGNSVDPSGGTDSGGTAAAGAAAGGMAAGGAGTAAAGGDTGSAGAAAGGMPGVECEDTGAADNFSFFVTSWHHIQLLSGSDDGFGGDFRWNGAATGLEGADAICQEIASRVCHGDKTWRAFLSTTQVDAIDRIGTGPWYDFEGSLVANDTAGLIVGEQTRQAGGCCEEGTFDELGIFHDGTTDVNNDGIEDDDHDTITGTDWDGRYSGFSCNDWTSADGDDQVSVGHSWPARSGQSWSDVHNSRGCGAGVNFIQGRGGDSSAVGGGGGYGGIYCFAE